MSKPTLEDVRQRMTQLKLKKPKSIPKKNKSVNQPKSISKPKPIPKVKVIDTSVNKRGVKGGKVPPVTQQLEKLTINQNILTKHPKPSTLPEWYARNRKFANCFGSDITQDYIKKLIKSCKKKDNKVRWDPFVAKVVKVLFPIKGQVWRRKHNCYDLILADRENPKETDTFRVYLATQCSWLIESKYLKKGMYIRIEHYTVNYINGKIVFVITEMYTLDT